MTGAKQLAKQSRSINKFLHQHPTSTIKKIEYQNYLLQFGK